MTQVEAFEIWKKGAIEALDSAEKLFEYGKYDHCLFMLHLAVEKSLKALFIRLKNEAPPFTHNLAFLSEKSDIEIDEQMKKDLVEISGFNVAGRYEEYKTDLYKKATLEYSSKWMVRGKEIFNFFITKL
jgi:HEPN domain-containing protein